MKDTNNHIDYNDLIVSEARLSAEVHSLTEMNATLMAENTNLNREIQKYRTNSQGHVNLNEIHVLKGEIFKLREKVNLISHAIVTLSKSPGVHALLEDSVKLLAQIFKADNVTIYFTSDVFSGNVNNPAEFDTVLYEYLDYTEEPYKLEDIQLILNKIRNTPNTTFDLTRLEMSELTAHNTLTAVISKIVLQDKVQGFILIESKHYSIDSEDILFLDTLTSVISSICYKLIITVKFSLHLEQSLKEMDTDPLTGVGSKYLFNDTLREITNKDQYPVIVIYCDMNGLKALNDTYGHDMGNEGLKLFASTLSDYIKPLGGELFRIGGDEFVVLIRNKNIDIVSVKSAMNSFNPLLVKKSIEHNLPVEITVSYGICTRQSDEPIEETVERADELMYQHKRVMKGELK